MSWCAISSNRIISNEAVHVYSYVELINSMEKNGWLWSMVMFYWFFKSKSTNVEYIIALWSIRWQRSINRVQYQIGIIMTVIPIYPYERWSNQCGNLRKLSTDFHAHTLIQTAHTHSFNCVRHSTLSLVGFHVIITYRHPHHHHQFSFVLPAFWW